MIKITTYGMSGVVRTATDDTTLETNLCCGVNNTHFGKQKRCQKIKITKNIDNNND